MTRVVYIDIDSLRADHVGAYGYSKETTPNIDAVAADGVTFQQAYVANSPCMPSRAGLISGRYGIHNGVETHGTQSQSLRTPAREIEWAGTWGDHTDAHPWWTLPELFFKNGVTTTAVSSFPRHPAHWFYHVWDEFHHPKEPDGPNESFQTPRGEVVAETANEVLDRVGDDEFFLYIQMWDPHGPYNRSEAQIEEFRNGNFQEYPTAEQIAEHQEWDAWRSASHMNIADRDDLEELLAHYDAEIRYADKQVGQVVETLKQAGLYDETFIVVTADHGEEFGEHGVYREHWSTHDGTQRVPLIVKPPASTSFSTGPRTQLATNVDMPPTLADFADLDPPENWQGRSLLPAIENPKIDWRSEIVVDHGLYTAQRAIRTDQWKLIWTFHSGMWETVVPKVQLYNMDNDPWEQQDVSQSHRTVVSELKERMSEWAETHAGTTGDTLKAVARDGPAGTIAFGDDFEGV
ncbi:sulfatase family protein [Haloarcula marina]|uniref:sulfatase family protein n=1 Tax=Haloarcula marina TaxID=2961574 RepID=UPI0020B67F9A|nr:sulfatase [Halomicroarcula marina]